jgi:regulator of extracellular matrix RemA (YlzA/DUF370 family)
MCALHAFGVWGVVSTERVVAVDTSLGFRRVVSTERVVAVDQPHYQYIPHLQSCWRKNLDLEAVNWGTVT